MANVYVNIGAAIEELKKAHESLTANKFDLAVARAINHTVAKAKSEATREIKKLYGARSKEIRSSFKITKASRKMKIGILRSSAPALPLIAFGARQVKSGVSVKIKGKRSIIKSAFISTMKSGHRGVFARGEYSRKGFKFRKKRIRKKGNDLNITELNTLSVSSALRNDKIQQHLEKHIQTHFPKRLARLLARS